MARLRWLRRLKSNPDTQSYLAKKLSTISVLWWKSCVTMSEGRDFLTFGREHDRSYSRIREKQVRGRGNMIIPYSNARFVSLTLLLLGLLAPAASQARAASPGGWETYFSEGEGIQKLLYVAHGQAHGDLYFRCRPGEGWILLIEDAVPQPDGRMQIVVEGTALSPLARVGRDETGAYTEVAIPADHLLLVSLPGRQQLEVNGIRYPISSGADRAAISDFLSACNRQG